MLFIRPPQENQKGESGFDKFMYYMTESFLVVGGLPCVILFFLATVSCLIKLVDQDGYEKCIYTEKVKKILSGKSQDDVSDMLEWHLWGSAICGYIIVIVYSLMLFTVIKPLYKFTGLIFIVTLILVLAFNSVSTSWLASNECDDTSYYRMAITNNIVLYL